MDRFVRITSSVFYPQTHVLIYRLYDQNKNGREKQKQKTHTLKQKQSKQRLSKQKQSKQKQSKQRLSKQRLSKQNLCHKCRNQRLIDRCILLKTDSPSHNSGLAQWLAYLTRNRSVVSSSPRKGPSCFT